MANPVDDEEDIEDPKASTPEEEDDESPASGPIPIIASTGTETHGQTLPDIPVGIQHYKDVLASEPLHSNYHPARLRQILGTIAGTLMGIGTGNPGVGMGIARSIKDAPYRGQLENWAQQRDQAKENAGIESGAQAAQLKGGTELATQYKNYMQGEAELSRKGAEGSRGDYYRGRTAALPGSYAEEVAGKVKEAEANHPEKTKGFDLVKINDTTGIVYNKDTGEQTPITVSSPDALDKFGADLKSGIQAREILADTTGKYGPAMKSAAKSHVDHEAAAIENLKSQSNTRGTTMMLAPGQPSQAPGQPDKPQTGIRVGPGTPVPQGSVTPSGQSSEVVNQAKLDAQQKMAKEEANKDYLVAKQLVDDGVAHPEHQATNDAALVSHFMGAMKPSGLTKMRFTQGEQNYIEKTRNSLGDLQAFLGKIANGARLTPQQRQSMLSTMNVIAHAGEDENPEVQKAKVVRGPDGKLQVQR